MEQSLFVGHIASDDTRAAVVQVGRKEIVEFEFCEEAFNWWVASMVMNAGEIQHSVVASQFMLS